uniref:Uncharacterized protein n=1 Tax=Tanacetum cinerariifolium TaxID=118510 RepID=A0A6L2NB75_TANCI|nr:hypothetical protein [Tanacetum cinerariifolium]
MFSSSTGLFSFQFSFTKGLHGMFENGPWFIKNNPLILKKWHPDENLLKEDVSTILVWVKLYGVPVTAFSKDGLSAIATKLGTLLMLDSYTSDMCMQSWGRSSYARVMIELRVDVELKDNIAVAMPKITKEGYYTCAGEKKTMNKSSQTSGSVPVGPKIGFKPQKEYRRVTKKPNASSSGNKKKGVEPTIEVSNSNPFDVLNSVNNDVEFESDSEVDVVFDGTANLRIPTSGKDRSDNGYALESTSVLLVYVSKLGFALASALALALTLASASALMASALASASASALNISEKMDQLVKMEVADKIMEGLRMGSESL